MSRPRPDARPDARLDGGLALAAAVVVLVTLLPDGGGWTWGAPLAELHWYATGLDSTATMLQLVGNLLLLAPAAVLAVLRWPALRAPGRLVLASGAAAGGIELLQWLLPLGRVVSPLDALLNTVGAVVAGGIVLLLRAPAPSAA
ncbi:VanZ family protein [Blastococcus haudaquaticus]|uniref:VanZ like family protein n=1 Tax=Blastococcus haudaquaticus TaxID=1938745 RepID=A0A286GSV2_9ACTN|nr:VanZ family protein [Blastococcus haudaquaticus]SOD98276.1 VanZ like family protein [Blastococcus haudaquaticus]